MRKRTLAVVFVSTFAIFGASTCKAARDEQSTTTRDRFLLREPLPAVRSIADLRPAISSAVALSDAGQDIRVLKSDLQASVRPVILLIAPDTRGVDALKSVAADAKGATVVVFVVSARSTITIDESSLSAVSTIRIVPILIVPKDALEPLATKAHQEPGSLYGLYVFDTRGAVVWFADIARWQALAQEASIVATTIATTLVADARLQSAISTSTASAPGMQRDDKRTSADRSTKSARATPTIKPAPPKIALSTLPVDNRPPQPAKFQDVVRSTDRRAVLVNFWATWCEPCRREFPELASLAAEHKDLFRYVGIVTDAASTPGAKDRVDQISPIPLRRMQYALNDVSLVNRLFPQRSYDAPRNVVVPLFALFDAGGRVIFRCEGSLLDHQNSVEFHAALLRLSKHRDEE